MKLRFTRRAVEDLNNIAAYLIERNPAGSKRVRAAILGSVRLLVSYPRAGTSTTTEGVRKLVVRRYPYLIYYTADEGQNEVAILGVKHAARKREHEDH